MPIRSRHVAASAALGLVLVFASCDKSPTRPGPLQPASPTVTTIRLELVAPPEIEPSESIQLTANAVKSDGSVENVSGTAQWASDPAILQVSSTGLATGKNRGEALVVARFGERSASARVFVLPKGTFRLTGTVNESGFAIGNVTVTVISGVGDGLTTTSGSNGFYALYGVVGPVRILLKKENYLDAIQHVDVTAHRTHDFTMVPDRPRRDYAGTYTLTISADSSCGSTPFNQLPDTAKRRTYSANVVQNVGHLTVTLTDGDFIVTNGYGNRFFGVVDPSDAITFAIGGGYSGYYYYSDHFDIVERFSGTALMVTGVVTARGTPQLISGTLAGEILISRRATAPFTPYSAACRSNMHGFEMERR